MKTMTPATAAQKLGITRERVRQLMKSGRIGFEKEGGRYFIEQKHLDKYVADKKNHVPGRPKVSKTKKSK